MKRNIIWHVVGLLVLFIFVFTSCGPSTITTTSSTSSTTTTSPTSSTTTTTSTTLSSFAQEISGRIAGINIGDTTALTSLFRISEEIDQAQSNNSISQGEWTELQSELMAKLSDWVDTREERLGLNSLPPAPTGHITWSANDSALMAGANERIEQYREGDLTVSRWLMPTAILLTTPPCA